MNSSPIFLSLTLWFAFYPFAWVRAGLSEKILFYDFNYQKNKWTKIGGNERESILSLIKILQECPTGKHLLSLAQVKAREEEKTLSEITGFISAFVHTVGNADKHCIESKKLDRFGCQHQRHI